MDAHRAAAVGGTTDTAIIINRGAQSIANCVRAVIKNVRGNAWTV